MTVKYTKELGERVAAMSAYLSQQEIAERVGVAPRTLRKWRSIGIADLPRQQLRYIKHRILPVPMPTIEAVEYFVKAGFRPKQINSEIGDQVSYNRIRTIITRLRERGRLPEEYISPPLPRTPVAAIKRKKKQEDESFKSWRVQMARAGILHLVDLKRAGHSPTRTELALTKPVGE